MRNIGRIMELAQRLSLTNLANKKSSHLEDASDEMLDFLTDILEEEIFLREEKRIERYRSRARLDKDMNFMSFDNKAQPKVTKTHIQKLCREEWINEGYNLIIVGSSGTGKSHLANAVGNAAVSNCRKVFYGTLRELLELERTKNAIVKSRSRLSYIKECDLVIIDEFGYTPLTEAEAVWTYEFVNQVNEMASMIIVANRPYSEWEKVFHDNIMATTLIDRLIGKSQSINMGTRSYRLANHENFITNNK